MPLRSEGSTFDVQSLLLLGIGLSPITVSRDGIQQLHSFQKTHRFHGCNTAATLVLNVFAKDDKIVWHGHLFTHLYALHDDDENLGKQ
jgi:hypothetical protein